MNLTAGMIRAASARVPAYVPVYLDLEIDGRTVRVRVTSHHVEYHDVTGPRPGQWATGLILSGESIHERAPGEPAPVPAELPRPQQRSTESIATAAGWKTRRAKLKLETKGATDADR